MPPMRAWLEQRIEPNVIAVHILRGHDTLGSGAGSLVPIEGPDVPHYQCTIVREGDVFRLRDVRGGRRGTLVNYRYVKEAVLVPGDEVRVGETVLRFNRLPGRPRRSVPEGERIVPIDLPGAGPESLAQRRDTCP